MGRKLRNMVGILKDRATITLTTHAPDLAVLRSTSHSPNDHFNPALILSFSSSSRVTANSLITSLSSRLSSTTNPTVALKCLLSLHHILSRGSFILLDAVFSSFKPSNGRRSPLNLSSFRSHSSLTLSSWVRYYARLLELFIVLSPLRDVEPDVISGLLNKDLLLQLEQMVSVLEEIVLRVPSMMNVREGLVGEVVGMVGEERGRGVEGIRVRVKEVKERFGELGFGEAVELVCLVRRVEGCCGGGEKVLVREMEELREKLAAVEESGRVRRSEKVSESARIDNSGRRKDERVIFGSNRWVSS